MSRVKIKRCRFPSKGKKARRIRLFFILLGFVVLSCVYIWQRVTVITLSAHTKKLRLQIEQKQKSFKYLQVEVAKLSSVERIEKIGKRMGFVYPDLHQIGLIRESSDSTYLEEKPGFPKNIWAKLKTIQKGILRGEEAVAKEIEQEP